MHRAARGSTFTYSRVVADASVYRAFGTPKIIAGEVQTPKVFALHGRAGFLKPDGVLHPVRASTLAACSLYAGSPRISWGQPCSKCVASHCSPSAAPM
jgi:hypothetical protein